MLSIVPYTYIYSINVYLIKLNPHYSFFKICIRVCYSFYSNNTIPNQCSSHYSPCFLPFRTLPFNLSCVSHHFHYVVSHSRSPNVLDWVNTKSGLSKSFEIPIPSHSNHNLLPTTPKKLLVVSYRFPLNFICAMLFTPSCLCWPCIPPGISNFHSM